jgi:hypothetical protein
MCNGTSSSRQTMAPSLAFAEQSIAGTAVLARAGHEE